LHLAVLPMDLQGLPWPVRTTTPNRLILALFVAGTLAGALLAPSRASAQEDTDTSLGDIARSLRKKPVPSPALISVDDDNLSKVMDDAETRRAAGASPVFSLDARGNDPGAKSFHVSSPDVTCSLSFTAKTSSLSDPLLLDDLPRAELAKLDGPATIDGDSLQVSMHNGTVWELREVVIGLTIVKRTEPGDTSSNFGQLRIVPAAAGGFPQLKDSFQKQPDVTLLLHVKGSAAPSTTATFRTALNFALFPDQEWHWAIVRAKGIPPQAPAEVMTMMQGEAASQPPSMSPEADSTITPPTPSPSNKIPASPDALPH
jgi:hypothetical protein